MTANSSGVRLISDSSLSGGAFFPNADLYVVDDPLYKAILSATFSL